ncbi:hypothetical protein [Mesorhizobium sp. M1D.F.Ca.ET.043.01.1.1]|uniref:hypothetical protein n=1 Tax=Mesorhizobium sp. M1D.F.Ca.ET.043.01.1.1 TaxID=2493669 RepID=UPI001FE0C990|nr:hypothetical protein [Mesorhizobium sp. M1D.F.Ca.ET.043.01.1.1]
MLHNAVERYGGSVEHRLDAKLRGYTAGQFHVYALVPRPIGREERIGREGRHGDAQSVVAHDWLWGVFRLLCRLGRRLGLRDQQPAASGRKQRATCKRHAHSQFEQESRTNRSEQLAVCTARLNKCVF